MLAGCECHGSFRSASQFEFRIIIDIPKRANIIERGTGTRIANRLAAWKVLGQRGDSGMWGTSGIHHFTSNIFDILVVGIVLDGLFQIVLDHDSFI